MKSHTRYLTMNVPARMDFVNITPDVEAEVRASGATAATTKVTAARKARLSIRSSSFCWVRAARRGSLVSTSRVLIERTRCHLSGRAQMAALARVPGLLSDDLDQDPFGASTVEFAVEDPLPRP